tara:strand:+ start:252 stop:443 length:192 start_codon:yes stop_codon:yes gene_type:complete
MGGVMMVAMDHIRHLILKFQVQVLVAAVVLEVPVLLQEHTPVVLDKVVVECNYLQHLEIQHHP